MGKSLLAQYDEFLKEREEFIAAALEQAFYMEVRGAETCRPIVKITSEKELLKLQRFIASWAQSVQEFVEGDPVRFKATATAFNPAPKLITNADNIYIRESIATSTRLIKRKNILRRLRNAERTESIAGTSQERLAKLREEISYFENSREEDYRIRSVGYKEIRVSYTDTITDRECRENVPLCGLFIYDPNNSIKITVTPPPETTRSDAISQLGVEPIDVSLDIQGLLFSEKKLRAAKEKRKKQ